MDRNLQIKLLKLCLTSVMHQCTSISLDTFLPNEYFDKKDTIFVRLKMQDQKENKTALKCGTANVRPNFRVENTEPENLRPNSLVNSRQK